MSIIKTMRKQTAVYWHKAANDGTGSLIYDDPIQITCRIQGGTKLVTDKDGNEVVSTGMIFPDSVLEVGGFVWEGGLADLNIEVTSPQDLDDAKEIITFSSIPNLKATEILYKAMLK